MAKNYLLVDYFCATSNRLLRFQTGGEKPQHHSGYGGSGQADRNILESIRAQGFKFSMHFRGAWGNNRMEAELGRRGKFSKRSQIDCSRVERAGEKREEKKKRGFQAYII